MRSKHADPGTVDQASLEASTLDLPAHSTVQHGTASVSAGDHRGWCGGASVGGPWLLVYDGFDPAQEGTREALCTLGNGYWGTRGSAAESSDDGVHYPGTYLAGVYNRVLSDVNGRTVETEHLVNAPNWTALQVRIGDGSWLGPATAELLSCHQRLDLRRGVLTRTVRYRDTTGRTTRLTTTRIVSQAASHLAAQQTTVEAEDWSGTVIVRATLDGRVSNRNVVDDRQLTSRHLAPTAEMRIDAETVLLEVATSSSQVRIAMAARTRVRLAGGAAAPGGHRLVTEAGLVAQEFDVAIAPGQPVTVETVVAVATSRDRAQSTPALGARDHVARAPDVDGLLDAHERAWQRLWERFGVEVEAGERQSLTLNLHVFHVLQSIAGAGADLDAGVPARGLHGEGYRGHVFWDELFVYPMLTLRRPELTRDRLRYRYRRLDRARAAARDAGNRGAMFPWQSGSDGREETPTQLWNPRRAAWMPDNSHRQRHVGLAVAYGAWQYYQATEDLAYLIQEGAELLVEVARFFASLAEYEPVSERYDIAGVMGPDEFHDGYPDAPGNGLRTNAYTNVLTAWTLSRALDALQLLHGQDCGPTWDRLALRAGETEHWEHVRRRLRVAFHADGVISQFAGYELLPELDWTRYRARYGHIGRLDLILAAEGDSTNNYRASKQADVLMLFYLLSAEELREVFDQLGYPLEPETIRRTVAFYIDRSSHGSTLCRLVHSWVLARVDRPASWPLFIEALDSDLTDSQGGTTREGVHLGAMAGTVDLVLRCYSGLQTRNGMLWLNPALPSELSRAAFEIVYHGQPVSVEISPDRLRLRLAPGNAAPIRVEIAGRTATLNPGQVHDVPLTSPDPVAISPPGHSTLPLAEGYGGPGRPGPETRGRGTPSKPPIAPC